MIQPSFYYTDQLHDRFNKDGFVLFRRLLTKKAVEFLRQRVDEVLGDLHPSVDEEWILNLHQVLPSDRNWMWQLIADHKIRQLVERRLGKQPVLYCSQISIKPPNSGRLVPWHQDGNEHTCTLWIPLDSISSQNGGLRVKRGCHCGGRLPYRLVDSMERLEAAEHHAKYQVYEVDLRSIPKSTPTDTTRPRRCMASYDEEIRGVAEYQLQAGGAGMHHPLVPHMSYPNQSARQTRRVIILRFQSRNEPRLAGDFKHWRTGKPMQRHFFDLSSQQLPSKY